MSTKPGSRSPKSQSNAPLSVAFAVLFSGCYYLMAGEVREGVYATRDALDAGKVAVAKAYIAPTAEIVGEPKQVPPLNLGAAELWTRNVKQKMAKIAGLIGRLLGQYGPGGAAAGGPLGLIALWLWKSHGSKLKAAGKRIVQLGQVRIDNASDQHAEKEKLRTENVDAGLEDVVNPAVKEAKNGNV